MPANGFIGHVRGRSRLLIPRENRPLGKLARGTSAGAESVASLFPGEQAHRPDG